ncbi:MAG: DUF488 domain-containing protein [Peptostreptococcaceae bacterium]|nr:DUF488 domain-containing protein [Peptostreptococcaceae bacterium]
MKIYTIGFSKKSAEVFFDLLIENKVDLLLDIRLNNKSQLAGFTKGKDLPYFLEKICNANYIHEEDFAPSKELLSNYKKNIIDWDEYVYTYRTLLISRKAETVFYTKYKDKYKSICLLCSELTADNCHRRLLAEYLIQYAEITGVNEIVHL